MRLKSRTFLLALAASAVAFPAVAQESDIVVTATRAPTPSDRLPARIDVIDRDDIETRGLDSLAEALGSDAVQTGGAGQQASLFLRGTNSKHALALLDGVRLNDASTPNGQHDFGLDGLGALERIEVMRGPASSIYGSDAIGGVVNLIPRRGGDAPFEPFLQFEGGSFDTLRLLTGAAGATESTEYGLTVESFRTEGFDLIPERMATFEDDPDGARLTTATFAVRNTRGAWGFDGLAQWRETAADFDSFSAGPFFDLRGDDPNLENRAERSVWRLGGDYTTTSDVRLRLEGGQLNSDRVERDDGFETSNAQAQRDFANLNFSGALGALSLSGGLAFEHEAIDTRPQFADPLIIDESHLSGYVIAQGDWADRLAFTGSARIDDYQAFGQHATYSIGATAFFGALRVFTAYGTAFKAPSLSERYEVSFFNLGNPDLEPERSRSWEVGADWRAHDAFRFSISYYQTEIDDLIEYKFSELRNVNIARAEIEGVEARATVQLRDRASVSLDYAWTDARNGETGARLARRSEHTLAINAELELSERLRLAASWRYVGERVDVIYDDAGAFVSANGETPAFDIGDAALRFALSENAEAFARVSNIADTAYEQPNAFAGAPRSFQFGIRARY
jgi:vitamin B12 transporter